MGNRDKGHNAERYYGKIFRKLGWINCVTSRYGSRQHDDCGIDLINLPFNIQIKAGKQKGMNYTSLILDLKQRISTIFKGLPEEGRPLIIIHRKDVGKGKRRTEAHDLVTMSFKDFEKIINMIEWEK